MARKNYFGRINIYLTTVQSVVSLGLEGPRRGIVPLKFRGPKFTEDGATYPRTHPENFEFTWSKIHKLLLFFENTNCLRFVCAFRFSLWLPKFCSIASKVTHPAVFVAIERLIPQRFASREHNFFFVLAKCLKSRERLSINQYKSNLKPGGDQFTRRFKLHNFSLFYIQFIQLISINQWMTLVLKRCD